MATNMLVSPMSKTALVLTWTRTFLDSMQTPIMQMTSRLSSVGGMMVRNRHRKNECVKITATEKITVPNSSSPSH